MELTYDEITTGLKYCKAVFKERLPFPNTEDKGEVDITHECLKICLQKDCDMRKFILDCLDKAEFSIFLHQEQKNG